MRESMLPAETGQMPITLVAEEGGYGVAGPGLAVGRAWSADNALGAGRLPEMRSPK